jgi:Leucine-rich repeat (LRR) protein
MRARKNRACAVLILIIALYSLSFAIEVLITGTVMDQNGKGIDKALVRLVFAGIQTETDTSGNFTLSLNTPVLVQKRIQRGGRPMLLGRLLHFTVLTEKEDVAINVYDLTGAKVSSIARQQCQQGTYMVDPLAGIPGSGVYVIRIQVGITSADFKVASVGKSPGRPVITRAHPLETALSAKRSAVIDTLIVSKAGYNIAKEVMNSYTGQHSFFMTLEIPGQKFANFARSDVADLAFLKDMTSLEWLNLDSNSFSDLSPLSHLVNLQYLNLRNNYLVSDITPLAGLTKLKTLNLAGDGKITNLTPLSGLASLEDLNLLSANGITDISPISKLINLKKLDLGWANGITSYAACSTLTNLEWIRIAGKNATSVSGISRLSNLQTVLLAHNSLVLIDLYSLPKVKTVDFQYCDSVQAVFLSDMPVIDTIDLSRVTGLVLLSLNNLAGLKYLKFGSNQLDSIYLHGLTSISYLETAGDNYKKLSFVKGLPSLTTLIVTGQSITDISDVAALTNLVSLTVRGDGLVNISPIASLANLKQLSFSYCGSLETIASIGQFKNLESLDLSNCRAIKSLAAISGLTKLKSLNIRYCQGLDTALPNMSQLTQLRYINMNNCSTLNNVSALTGLNGINSIDIRYCGLDSATVGPVLSVLGSGDTLKFSSSMLTDAQINELTTAGVVMPKY